MSVDKNENILVPLDADCGDQKLNIYKALVHLGLEDPTVATCEGMYQKFKSKDIGCRYGQDLEVTPLDRGW